MKPATSLATCFGLWLAFVTAGPTAPFPQDVSSTISHTWTVFKPALNGWTPHDTLSKRSPDTEPSTATGRRLRYPFPEDRSSPRPTTTEPERNPNRTEPNHELDEATSTLSKRSGKGESSEMEQPLLQHPIEHEPKRFEHASSWSSAKTKAGWMAGSGFQWNGDDDTRKWVRNASTHRKFHLMKEVCHDNLTKLDCRSGMISVKPFSPGFRYWDMHSHYAAVHNLDKPLRDGGTTRAVLSPAGQVWAVDEEGKPRSTLGSFADELFFPH